MTPNIKDIVINLMKHDYSTMTKNVHTALQEKVGTKLQEMKKIISKNLIK